MRPLLILLLAGSAAHAQARARGDRVDALLARMTLEEKVGQMTQVDLAVIAADSQPYPDSVVLDAVRLREAVVRRGVGSIFNAGRGALSARAWQSLVRQVQEVALRETRLGIPVLYGIDAVHGHNYAREATLFPHNLALAATFDSALAERVAEVTAREMLATGLRWNFAPVLDVGRHPGWPRFYETWGEDPHLASVLGAATVRGLQRGGEVAATLKHYLGYGAPRLGRDRTPSDLSARAVREQVLPPFVAGIQAGARAVMVNSGELDGEPVHASRYWLHDVLRLELGFTGVVVTDWEDVNYLHTRHRVAPTLKAATRMAVLAGIDMSMTPKDFAFADDLAALVREGAIPAERIDQSVRRILVLKAQLGLLDTPFPDPAQAGGIGLALSRALARQAAREAIVLLRNVENLLPLPADARLLVTGPAARSLAALHGGWSYTWLGTDTTRYPAGALTVWDAIRARNPNARFVAGGTWDTWNAVDSARVLAAAADAEVVLVAVGEEGYAEWTGDVPELALPAAQLRLVTALQRTGKPVVVLLLQGRPRIIRPVVDSARAILAAFWPGGEGATAIAEVLFGEVNPSGRLPFSYPRASNALVTYDRRTTEVLSGWARDSVGFSPEFEFGHGLGYTRFTYRALQLSPQVMAPTDTVLVEVTVSNAGERDGEEVALLFVRPHYRSVTPPVRKLVGFQRVALRRGESRRIAFRLAVGALSFVDRNGRRVYEPGTFDVLLPGVTSMLRLTASRPPSPRPARTPPAQTAR